MSDLPALDQAQSYVVVGPDDQRGPYTLELLVSEVVAGRLDDNTPVWWPGLPDWTTMVGHPAVAAEIARRRGAPQQAPTAFAPPAAPPPPQGQQPLQPEPTPMQTAAVDEVMQAAAPPAAEPVAAESVSPQTVSPETRSPEPVVAEPVPSEPVFGVGTGSAEGDGSEPIDVPAVEVTPADFEAADAGTTQTEGFRAAGAGEGLDPMHGAAFADLIERSRARADAASIVENANDAFVAAFDAAASAQGFTPANRSDSGDHHELSYSGAPGETLVVRLGKVTGHALATGDAHVDLDVSCASERFSGSLDAGTGEHGEVIVAATETGAGAASSVSLHLPIDDYLDADHAVDEAALRRDADGVVATLAHRVRS